PRRPGCSRRTAVLQGHWPGAAHWPSSGGGSWLHWCLVLTRELRYSTRPRPCCRFALSLRRLRSRYAFAPLPSRLLHLYAGQYTLLGGTVQVPALARVLGSNHVVDEADHAHSQPHPEYRTEPDPPLVCTVCQQPPQEVVDQQRDRGDAPEQGSTERVA